MGLIKKIINYLVKKYSPSSVSILSRAYYGDEENRPKDDIDEEDK